MNIEEIESAFTVSAERSRARREQARAERRQRPWRIVAFLLALAIVVALYALFVRS